MSTQLAVLIVVLVVLGGYCASPPGRVAWVGMWAGVWQLVCHPIAELREIRDAYIEEINRLQWNSADRRYFRREARRRSGGCR